MVSRFRHLIKHNTLRPLITIEDLTTSTKYPANNRNGYDLQFFDIRYQQYFATLQPINEEFEYSPQADAAVVLNE